MADTIIFPKSDRQIDMPAPSVMSIAITFLPVVPANPTVATRHYWVSPNGVSILLFRFVWAGAVRIIEKAVAAIATAIAIAAINRNEDTVRNSFRHRKWRYD